MIDKTVSEYALYVVSNIGRATLSNALNIADRLDNPQYYDFKEFVECVNSCIKYENVRNALGTAKIAKIISLSYDALKKYNSDFKYQKRWIIDNYIIEMWCAVNDK